MLTIKNIINYFVCVESRGVCQGSALKTVFSVLFFLKCIKKNHFRSTWAEQFYLVLFLPFIVLLLTLNWRNSYIRGTYDISSFFVKKSCFRVLLLNSLADKDSRFNIVVQLHLMDPVSFWFRTHIWGRVFVFLLGFSFAKTHRTAGEGRGPSFIPL